MSVEGRVLTSSVEPIPGAVIGTWETESEGEQIFNFVRFSSTEGRHKLLLPRKATTALSTPRTSHPIAEYLAEDGRTRWVRILGHRPRRVYPFLVMYVFTFHLH
jgi:hypothetical protein